MGYIYVSNYLYNNLIDLNESEYVGSVGGIEKEEITINLLKEQYVYVKYNEVVAKPIGLLGIKKID